MQNLVEAYALEIMLYQKCEKLRHELLDAGFEYVASWNLNRSGTISDRIKTFESIFVPEDHKHSLILKDLAYVAAVFTNIIDKVAFKQKYFHHNLPVKIDLSFYKIIVEPYPPLVYKK